MEFGRVPEFTLDSINFSLPKDPDLNKAFYLVKKLRIHKYICRLCKMGKERVDRENLCKGHKRNRFFKGICKTL